MAEPEHYDQADFAQSEAIAMLSIRRHRQYRRFNRRYPVHMRLPSGDLFSELDAVSRNVSLFGLLLETAAIIPQQSPVSFVITVQGEQIVRPIELAGEGKVVRVEDIGTGAGFAVAIECKDPISQIENIFPNRAN